MCFLANAQISVRIALRLTKFLDIPSRRHMASSAQSPSYTVFATRRRKARYVTQGNMTEAPRTLTYASVVSRESVRIVLTHAALNDLEVKSADIKNYHQTAPVTEKIWTILGPEFSEDTGKKAIIVRTLYGLKSTGLAFKNHLADCMKTSGYQT